MHMRTQLLHIIFDWCEFANSQFAAENQWIETEFIYICLGVASHPNSCKVLSDWQKLADV